MWREGRSESNTAPARQEPAAEVPVSESFQLLLETVPDCAAWTLDAAGRVTGWTPSAERLLGFRADEVRGAPFSRFYLAAEVESGHPARALELAARLKRFEDEGLRVRRDGTFWAHVAITALRSGGQVTGFAVLARDLSGQRRAEERVREAAREEAEAERMASRFKLLADAARSFAEAAPRVDLALAAVTHRVAECLGDACVVALAEGDGPLRPAAVAHPDPEGRRLLRELVESSFGHPAALPTQVFRTGVPMLFTKACADTRLSQNPVVRAFCHRFGASSLILVPLRARGRAIGVIGVTRGVEVEPYGEEDLSLLQQLADLAALALENARLFEEARSARAAAEADRQRVEVAVARARDQRAWLESVLDSMPTPLILVEPGSHRITFANRAAESLAGGPILRLGSEAELCARLRCTDAEGLPFPPSRCPACAPAWARRCAASRCAGTCRMAPPDRSRRARGCCQRPTATPPPRWWPSRT